MLDYKITNVSFYPDVILLEYNKETKTFISTVVLLNVETNIPVNEGADSFTYSLSMIKNTSVCDDHSEKVIDGVSPKVMLGSSQLVMNTPLTPLTFADQTDGFLSDKNEITLIFEELDASIKSCSGDISVEVGVDI